jgi:mono/diheme cytochrome c family protein
MAFKDHAGPLAQSRACPDLVSSKQMRFRPYFVSLVFTFCAAGLAVVVAGCRKLPPSMPPSQWNAQEARGAEVFRQNCARCHYPASTRGLHGPGLQALTKQKSMPSGAPPTDEMMTEVILHGHGMMPATALTDSQLQDLLAYLHTL